VYMLKRCEQLRGFVFEFSNCTDEELATYLHHAQALLFPSFAEGYGMPLVEALSYGVPVIASDLPVFREVAGEIPEYVDPLDGRRWCEMVKEYAKSDSQPRAKQLTRCENFITPTWADHFAKVDALLEQLSGPKSCLS
jgi:glycosyltransferase involved in cell wall biosynthesis